MSSSANLQREASAARVGLSSALDELRDSVTTTALTNGAMTFAKEGSSAVARAAVDRAMASPLAAMLIGAGIFMLMSGGNKNSQVGAVVHKGNEAIKSTAHTIAGVGSSIAGVASSALSAVSRASGAVSDTAAATADRVKTAAGDASDVAAGAYDKASDLASGAYDKASDAASGAIDKASSMATDAYGRARNTVGDLTAQGLDQGKHVIDQTQAMVSEAQGRLEQFAREQPILVAALGVAFGAALGASLPITKAEQDYMGDAARKAGEVGSDIAKKVADSVTHQVSGGDVKAKLGEVADAITSTVTSGDVKAKVAEVADSIKSAVSSSISART